jgi:hypothetical protein
LVRCLGVQVFDLALATHVARDLGTSRATLYRRMGEVDARQWITSQTR